MRTTSVAIRRRFQKVPDAAKQLAAGHGGPACTALGDGRGDEVGQRFAARGKLRDEFRELVRPALDEPVAPPFRAPEPRGVEACHVVPGVERGADRSGIEAAQELGDELALAHERTAARDPARELDGVGKLVRQAEAGDQLGRRVDQAVREVLDRVGLSLQFGLGGRRNAAGQFAAAHRKILPRAALRPGRAPVQSRGPMTEPTQPDQRALEQVVERALALARSTGATAAEAGVGVSTGLSVTVRLGEVETLEYQRDRSLGVTVYSGHRKGSASTANLSPAAVEETVAKAISIASFTADDEYAGLPDADRMASRLPDLDLSHPWDLEAPAAVDLARRCESAGLGHDTRIRNSEGASVSTHRKLRVFGNSHGFIGGYPSTSHSVSCVVVGQDGGDMQRDYWYSAARDWRELEDVESVGRIAAERAVRRLGAGKLATRKAPVLFAPELARGLVGHFTGAIGGAAQYRRSSFLLDAMGERVFPEQVSLVERPHLPGALGSAPFDSEGVATRDRELVVDGMLGGYLLDSYSARKLGLVTTGNAGGVHNLVVQGRMLDAKTLLRTLGTGLLVTEMMGQGVNAVTGDYSRGAAGFWVENGEIARPVHEITVAGNLREMFLGIAALGDDVDRRGAIHCGSLLIGEMTIAGD
jgi:PmbA protein